MGAYLAKPEHEIVYQDVVSLVQRYAGKLKPIEVLAVASNMVGKLIAMQDQFAVSPEQAMQVVSRNIQVGNSQVIEQIAKSRGSA